MNADYILNRARKSIGRFCQEECHAFCCRKCYLVLKESQVDTVTQGKREELVRDGLLLKTNDGNWSLNMGSSERPCPSLDMTTFTCKIHESMRRPKTCREFPMFVDGKTLKLSPRCLAVKLGMLYPFVRQLISLGYKLVEAEPYSETELYRMEFQKDRDSAERGEIKT